MLKKIKVGTLINFDGEHCNDRCKFFFEGECVPYYCVLFGELELHADNDILRHAACLKATKGV